MNYIKLLAEILSEFGPFAICACIFVALWWLFTKDRYKSLGKTEKKYLFFTTEIIILVIVAVWIISHLFLKPEYIIKGRIENISAEDRILSGELFLKRNYYGNPEFFDYEWRIITSVRMKPGEEIKFVLDRSTSNEEKTCDYILKFNPIFYDDSVKIKYSRDKDMMYWCCIKDDEEEKIPLVKTIASHQEYGDKSHSSQLSELSGMLFAHDQTRDIQETPRNFVPREKEIIRNNLASADIIIRRIARDKLSRHGVQNVEFINELLNSGVFWEELGALEAIRCMEQNHLRQILFNLDKNQIQVLTENENPTLSQSAVDVLNYMSTINI